MARVRSRNATRSNVADEPSPPYDACMSAEETMVRSDDPPATVAVVVLTHNRVHLLRSCVDKVLARTSKATTEIVIWNNGSTDGTKPYLDALTDPRIRVVHSPKNIGQNGYARAFALTTAEYLVELDDDVVDAPEAWDLTLMEAFRNLPDIGFLAADIEDDPHDIAAHYRYRLRSHLYSPIEVNGITLLEGPAGGGCAMTSRHVYDRVGGFRQHKRQTFWQEETAFIQDIQAAGYWASVYAELKVLHTGGPHYAVQSAEKDAYWRQFHRSNARRAAIKRALLRVPFLRRLNARHGWFVEPA